MAEKPFEAAGVRPDTRPALALLADDAGGEAGASLFGGEAGAFEHAVKPTAPAS
jgi:hypothetical protein